METSKILFTYLIIKVSVQVWFILVFSVKSPMYILSQLLGATLASLTLKALFNDSQLHVIATQYTNTTTDLEAIIWEFIMTYILMFTICAVATDHRAV